MATPSPTYEELQARVALLEQHQALEPRRVEEAVAEALKECEARIRANEERLRLALDAANAGMWEWDLRTNANFWSETLWRLYGLEPHSCQPSYETWLGSIHPEDRMPAAQAVSRAARDGTDLRAEWRVQEHGGGERWLMSQGRPIRNEDGQVVRYLGIVIEITERKRAEVTLRETQSILQAAMDQSSAGIAIADAPTGTLRYVNDAGLLIRGGSREEAVQGVGIDEYVSSWQLLDLDGTSLQPDAVPLARAILFGEKNSRELIIRRSLTDDRIVLAKAAPITNGEGKVTAGVVVFVDITEAKRAEQERAKLEGQLRQAQKMETVGRLAGGIAHDFNNMLGVILGHAALALETLDPEEPLRSDLEEIHRAAKRSADLTRQLLAFARKQTVSPVVLDLNTTVEGLIKMLQRILGENIQLFWRPCETLWPVKIDPSQVDQALTNLCVNARDAIVNVGKLTIETGNVTLDEASCAAHPDAVPGEFVRLAVSDNGRGMDKDTLSRLFEPFFTTKGQGKGTGLGLATLYGAVKQNRGFIDVHSDLGVGSTFSIHLPRYQGGTACAQAEVKEPRGQRGHETILLVEDEPAILRVTKRMLEQQGYLVVATSNPAEGVRIATEHAGRVHLLLTDVVMPEMNGRELAELVVPHQPGMRLLFMSGYPANVIAHQGVLAEGANFIQKPFATEDLANAVRAALGGKRGPDPAAGQAGTQGARDDHRALGEPGGEGVSKG